MSLWRRFRQQASLWREVALPGLLLIVLVLLGRWLGLLQVQEWMALDSLSRRCPAAPASSSIVIVGIDEADLNAVGGFPVPDQTLADLLTTLQANRPAVIGLNLLRAKPVPPGHKQLAPLLAQSSNLIGAEIALSGPNLNVQPPPMLPLARVGFVDATVDEDGKLRRLTLVNAAPDQTIQYAFALKLAQTYLAAHQIPVQLSPHAGDPIRLGNLRLERFRPNSGGYVRADASGNQILLNFCANQQLFQVLSLRDVLQHNFAPEIIRDRIVIIGMTAPSVKDVFFTSAFNETLSARLMGKLLPATQLIYGVEVQAHATDQLINAVLQKEPQLQVWADFWEYLWIAGWGLLGILLGILLQSPWKSLVSLVAAAAALLGLSFLALMLGWWIPLVPAGLALGGAGLITTFFDRDLRFELEYRRMAVERTYEAVHNGPLQHLAIILRNLDSSKPEQLQQQLQSLNEELRNIFEHMRQTMLTRSDRLYLEENLILDLQAPISELLYQVHNYTLEMQAPGFAEIHIYVSPDFEILKRKRLSIQQKRSLCLFLQESLWNVGNHAIGATRLDVICTREVNHYLLRIVDNGSGSRSTRVGEGTKQAEATAWELNGRFQRRPNDPQGTICELIFPVRSSRFRRLRRFW